MEPSVLSAVLIPGALAVIMLGIGLDLTLDDFRRVAAQRRAVWLGLLCQSVLLPIACFGLAHAFALPPALAVGLMLVAASPGGTTANLFSHLAGGDVALNLTLTATSSLLSLATLPVIVNVSLEAFFGAGRVVPLATTKVAVVLALVLAPTAAGMGIRRALPALAARLRTPVKIAASVFLVLVIAATLYRARASLPGFFRQVGPAALAFNLVSLGVGYALPLLGRLPRRAAIAIALETGVHNGTMAIAVASSPLLLGNETMAIPAVIYSIIMLVTAAVFAAMVARTHRRRPASDEG